MALVLSLLSTSVSYDLGSPYKGFQGIPFFYVLYSVLTSAMWSALDFKYHGYEEDNEVDIHRVL